MPLEMNREVFITCAVTGSGATQDKSPHVPRSPKQIAQSAIWLPNQVRQWCIAMCATLKPARRAETRACFEKSQTGFGMLRWMWCSI